VETNTLKKFAQAARRQLIASVDTTLEQVIHTDSAELREMGTIVNKLQKDIKEHSRQHVVENAAYAWFNRFCALRFMDVNHYTPVGVVSPVEGFTQPEILQDAKKGLVDAEFNKVDKQRVFGLLNGQIPFANPQQEAYRWLLVGACNSFYERMPFLFPEIDDYTALLMPSDLLSNESILSGLRETLTADICKDVEVIGWLYQFYISEKKDQVMARKSAVHKEDIPAVTQLFTPHWIVRYLVENSLGRLWMLNHPNSQLIESMEFFIKPDQQEIDFIKINSPEEIKICDPACGSGHMLTYTFDLLAVIYEEQGFDPVQIPSLIIKNNLFGIEIDDRAGQLAAFALMMKARQRDKRFFTRGINPNICVMEDITYSEGEIKTYMDKMGGDLFTQELWFGLRQFEDAKTFGSLIRPQIHNPKEVLLRLQEKGAFEDLFQFETNCKVKKTLEMIKYLNQSYQVVVTNPPYFGKGMDSEYKQFAGEYYPDSKSDSYAMFIERCMSLSYEKGYIGLMTPYVWMFLTSLKKIRRKLIDEVKIINLVKPSYTSFFSSAIVPIVAFVFTKNKTNQNTIIFDLGYLGSADSQPLLFIDAINGKARDLEYICNTNDFLKIPGFPFAYWVSDNIRNAFRRGKKLGKLSSVQPGLQTSDNDRFVRGWHEVEISKVGFGYSNNAEAKQSGKKWFPYNKGGKFRKWYGNNELVVNWFNDGNEIKEYINNKYPYLKGNIDYVVKDRGYYFREALTWSKISSSYFGVRYSPKGFLFDVAGSSLFPERDIYFFLGFLCSKIAFEMVKALNPTMNIQPGNVADLPLLLESLESKKIIIEDNVKTIIDLTTDDWNSYENSWNFTEQPFIKKTQQNESLEIEYHKLNKIWKENIKEIRKLEVENNHLLIEAYGLSDDLSPDVPIDEITLTCNEYYRYGGKKSDEKLKSLLLIDTIKEFISYGVGCMFRRYSLDKPGLILANQGENLQDYLNQVPQPRFLPDKDNVLPILEGEWFADDIVSRFREFMKVSFGEENFEENLAFLENAIGKDIRSYFLRDFYNEHVKMYKKRPIYWLISSPKGSFNALIYMHRYQPDTVSIVLNQYLIPYREKLTTRKSHLQVLSQNGNANSTEKNKAIKEINTINAVLLELKEFEDNVLYPLARERIVIDLDDGVKVNYAKFGKSLKYVAELSE